MSESGPKDPREGKVPAAGQLLKRSLLGTEAVYRVIGENDRGVEVEVVGAPGLPPGSRFTFAREDVLAMDELGPAEAARIDLRRDSAD